MENKDYNFITPVSMPCTQEQFDKDLKEPLQQMGYITTPANNSIKNIVYLFEAVSLSVASSEEAAWIVAGGVKFEIYNAKHFLALAAMTDRPEGIDGEMWMCLETTGNSIKDKIYSFEPGLNKFPRYWKKATVEEINNHFKSSVYSNFKLPRLQPTEWPTEPINSAEVVSSVKKAMNDQINIVCSIVSEAIDKSNMIVENSQPQPLFRMTGIAQDLWDTPEWKRLYHECKPFKFWVEKMKFTGSYDKLLKNVSANVVQNQEIPSSSDRGSEPMGTL